MILPRVVAKIWWCEDEVCDCRQAVVELVTAHPTFARAVQYKLLAAGPFYSDGEGSGHLQVQRDHLAVLYNADVVL